MEKRVKGIEGYANVTPKFIEATMATGFSELHKDFIKFIPRKPSRVLDIGAGIGRDAWELSGMGHTVVAIEPTDVYRAAGKELFVSENIEWIDDSWPALEQLGKDSRFDFILASGVFHHLDVDEQHIAIIRTATLLNRDGIFALSLRNGSAGAGTCVFPTDSGRTIKSAVSCGLSLRLRIDRQPSLVKAKKDVVWSKLVFQKNNAVM